MFWKRILGKNKNQVVELGLLLKALLPCLIAVLPTARLPCLIDYLPNSSLVWPNMALLPCLIAVFWLSCLYQLAVNSKPINSNPKHISWESALGTDSCVRVLNNNFPKFATEDAGRHEKRDFPKGWPSKRWILTVLGVKIATSKGTPLRAHYEQNSNHS